MSKHIVKITMTIFYDINVKTSCFVGSIMTNSIKRHKVLGLGSIPLNSSQIVCNCDALLKCHKIFVIDHHISCSVCSPHNVLRAIPTQDTTSSFYTCHVIQTLLIETTSPMDDFFKINCYLIIFFLSFLPPITSSFVLVFTQT